MYCKGRREREAYTVVKIDLITGFLGSGKTTFIRKYVKYLVDKGYNVGILENDYGAVNVDMMLLQDLMGPNCHAEMVAGGCGEDCHKRRFKTKLIAMGMSGYDRVIVEPSGIFDVDEFFDTLHEEPLDRWYEVGSIIAIVDAKLDTDMSRQSRYVLASEIANCGALVMSKTSGVSEDEISHTKEFVNKTLEEFQCRRRFDGDVITKDWELFGSEDYERFMSVGYKLNDFTKIWFKQSDVYSSVYIMNRNFTREQLVDIVNRVFSDKKCGDVFRIKGFFSVEQDSWLELNATVHKTEIKPIDKGQKIIIIIGSDLMEDKIKQYFEE